MTWRRVDPYFARRIQLAVFLIAVGFGADYLVTPVGSSKALTALERSWLPLWAWGVVIIAAGISGFIVERFILGQHHPLVMTAQRQRWGWVSNTAHATLLAAFVALTGSSLADILVRGVDGGGWYGWRTALLWGLFAFINWQYVRRLGDPL